MSNIDRVQWPHQGGWIPSEFIHLPKGLGYIVATLPELTDREQQVPTFHLKWTSEYQLEVSASLGLHEHARNLEWFAGDREGFVIVDHGPDRPPFEGGQSCHYYLEKGQWQKRALPGGPAFNFDVSISSNLVPGRHLCVTPNLNTNKSQIFLITPSGEFEELKLKVPQDLTFDKYMTAQFVDLDGDGRDELILGGRGTSNRDYVMKYESGEFYYSNIHLPEKLNPGWETVCILAEDLDSDGHLDIVTLNHDTSISQGSIEIYRKNEEQFTRLELPPEIERLPNIRGQWLHRAHPIVLHPSQRKDLLITIRRTDYSKDIDQDQAIYLRNHGGGEFEAIPIEHPLLRNPVLGADVVIGPSGSQELLLVCFDGTFATSPLLNNP